MIRYSLRETSLGWLLVAETDEGVIRVAFADAPGRLESEFHAEWVPRGATARAQTVQESADAVLAAVEEPLRAGKLLETLPVAWRGSAFQRDVWQSLRRIPVGETTTYSRLASVLGRSGAARAVGGAVAANAVAVVVPCHRVVRADGSVGGFRWGHGRKRALLEREGAAPR